MRVESYSELYRQIMGNFEYIPSPGMDCFFQNCSFACRDKSLEVNTAGDDAGECSDWCMTPHPQCRDKQPFRIDTDSHIGIVDFAENIFNNGIVRSAFQSQCTLARCGNVIVVFNVLRNRRNRVQENP